MIKWAKDNGVTVTNDFLGLPAIPPSEHVWAAFLSLKPARDTANGREPWDWLNVEAFARSTLRVSEPWEIEALVGMSAAYVTELHQGKDALTMAPCERDQSAQ